MTSNMKSLFSQHGKKVIMGLLFVVFTSAFCLTAYAATTKSITIIANGHKTKEFTHSQTVEGALKEQGISPKAHDGVTPGLNAKVTNGMTIKWLPAVQVQLEQGDQSKSVWTTTKTVGDFLKQEGITVTGHDAVSPSSDTPVTQGMIIQYKKGIKVTLNIGGKAQAIWTTPMTVKALLDQQNVTLGKQDKVTPNLDTEVNEGSQIVVTRVTTKKDVVKESVDYKVVNKTDSHLTNGQTKTVQSGKEGERDKTYLVTYENGKQVKRDLVKTEIVKTPQNKIVAHGTKVVNFASTTSRSLSSGGTSFEMVSTGYTADCNGCTSYTATGINLNAHPNAKVIAVDPSIIPLGTKVYVQGYGYAVAADTGGAIHGNRIDLFFSSKSEANSWGYRQVSVRILK